MRMTDSLALRRVRRTRRGSAVAGLAGSQITVIIGSSPRSQPGTRRSAEKGRRTLFRRPGLLPRAAAGAEDQVPVVGHEAPGEQVHGHGPQRPGQDGGEGGVVGVGLEQCHAPVAAVEGVECPAGGGEAGGAGHRRTVPQAAAGRQGAAGE